MPAFRRQPKRQGSRVRMHLPRPRQPQTEHRQRTHEEAKEAGLDVERRRAVPDPVRGDRAEQRSGSVPSWQSTAKLQGAPQLQLTDKQLLARSSPLSRGESRADQPH